MITTTEHEPKVVAIIPEDGDYIVSYQNVGRMTFNSVKSAATYIEGKGDIPSLKYAKPSF